MCQVNIHIHWTVKIKTIQLLKSIEMDMSSNKYLEYPFPRHQRNKDKVPLIEQTKGSQKKKKALTGHRCIFPVWNSQCSVLQLDHVACQDPAV